MANWSPGLSYIQLISNNFLLLFFRARLSEVSHGLAVQGPSLSEESVDNLSLSSSYASSLSSSCSSLTTLMRSNGSLRGSRRRKVTWTDEVGQTGEVVSVLGENGPKSSGNTLRPPPPDYGKATGRPQLQRQVATIDQPPSSPDSESTSSPISPAPLHTNVQYNRSSRQGHKLEELRQWSSSESYTYDGGHGAKRNTESAPKLKVSKKHGESCSNYENGYGTEDPDSLDSKCDVAKATNRSHGTVKGDGVDLLESSQSQDQHHYVNVMQCRTESLPSAVDSMPDRTKLVTNQSRIVQRTKSESDVSSVGNVEVGKLSVRVKTGTKIQTKSLSADGGLHHGFPSPPEQFKRDSATFAGGKEEGASDTLSDSSEDENDPFGSHNVRAMQEAMKNMRRVPIVEKIGNSTENLHQLFAKHLPPHKYNMVKSPASDYVEKVPRPNTNGKSSVAVVTVSGEEDEGVSTQNFADKRGQTLKRLNSDDSIVSSSSSNATWSESDQQESPRPKRSGILNTGKKSGDGKKSKSEKHITFALDTDLGDKDKDAPNRKTGISKRRDLSPIYETPDLLRLSRNGGSALRQNIQHQAAKIGDKKTGLAGNDKGESGKTLEERLYRLFSYSSDDDNESNYSEDSAGGGGGGGGGGGHVARKDQYRPGMKIPPGLVS